MLELPFKMWPSAVKHNDLPYDLIIYIYIIYIHVLIISNVPANYQSVSASVEMMGGAWWYYRSTTVMEQLENFIYDATTIHDGTNRSSILNFDGKR